jgi:Mor family transcriptional regulator
LNDATNPEALSLCNDMTCILVECHRDRLGDGVFRSDASHADLTELAALLARRLAPRIGGRYIPKRDVRAERDAAVWLAFTGRNHKDVMREFDISRRLLYSILARRRRSTS